MAMAAEHAERGGRGSGILIGDSCVCLEGRELGTEATEETKAKEHTPETQEVELIAERIEQPHLRHFACTHTQVSPRPQ